MRRIAVALSKGGVGKTTTAVNLAAGLALRGKKVLLIDVDTQGQVAGSLGCRPEAGLAELVAGECERAQAVIEARENLSLLAGGRALAGLKRLITRLDYGGERTISDALNASDSDFEYVILDTSPGWDALTINALFYAEQVLAPVSPEILTLQGLLEFNRSLEAIKRHHPDLELAYVLPTFFDRRVRKSAEIVNQLDAYFSGRVCAPIRYNVRISEAPGYGQTIFEYAPTSTGALDYLSLTERILEDE